MKAIVHDGRRAAMLEVPTPTPAAGEALVRVRRASPTVRDAAWCAGGAGGGGGAGSAPTVLGARFAGVIERLGPGAVGLAVGDRVVAGPVVACGGCDLCRGGLTALCRRGRAVGAPGGAGGGLAEWASLPASALSVVPAGVEDAPAALAELVAAGVHAALMARAERGRLVTVLGDTGVALAAAQWLARGNAAVRLLGADESLSGLCERWGVKFRRADDAGRRADQDVVIDASASVGAGLPLAVELVRPRGLVIVASSAGSLDAAETPGSAVATLAAREVTLRGARGGSIPEALRLMARGEIDAAPLITGRGRLAEGLSGVRAAGEPGQLAVVLDAA